MFVVKFMGGIGNQIFQLSFCYYLQKLYPEAEIRSDLSYFKTNECHGGYLIDNNPFNVINEVKLKEYNYIFDTLKLPILDINKNYYFDGYWQQKEYIVSELSFDQVFDISNFPDNEIDIKQRILKYSDNSVALHVRCGDYNNLFDLGNVATKYYYNNAILEIKKSIDNPYFFIFSNDIEWAKKNLKIDKDVFFVNSNNAKKQAIWDLYLMSLCSNFIISNSSFSWWAQQFQKSHYKIVYTPEYWMNERNVSVDEYGKAYIQNYSFMKKVLNIPLKNDSEVNLSDIAFVFIENNSILNVRRFITTFLCENVEGTKLFIKTNNRKIKEFINVLKENNNKIVLYTSELDTKQYNYVFVIKGNYYLGNDKLQNLILEVKDNNYERYLVPYKEQPLRVITDTHSKKTLLLIKNNNTTTKKGYYKLQTTAFYLVKYKEKTVIQMIRIFIKKIFKLIKL